MKRLRRPRFSGKFHISAGVDGRVDSGSGGTAMGQAARSFHVEGVVALATRARIAAVIGPARDGHAATTRAKSGSPPLRLAGRAQAGA
jgi:hypothetical protein